MRKLFVTSAIMLFIGLFGVSASCKNAESPRSYTVTFIQQGQSNLVKTVNVGEILTDIPSPVEVAGYDAVWDRNDFTKITGNTKVTAILTPKEYTIIYDAGELKDNQDLILSATEQKVVFNTEYTLLKPTCKDYKFIEWKIKDTTDKFENGVYQRASDTELVAVWEKDDEESHWTGYYSITPPFVFLGF